MWFQATSCLQNKKGVLRLPASAEGESTASFGRNFEAIATHWGRLAGVCPKELASDCHAAEALKRAAAPLAKKKGTPPPQVTPKRFEHDASHSKKKGAVTTEKQSYRG